LGEHRCVDEVVVITITTFCVGRHDSLQRDGDPATRHNGTRSELRGRNDRRVQDLGG
jgi:hypothetical protein